MRHLRVGGTTICCLLHRRKTALHPAAQKALSWDTAATERIATPSSYACRAAIGFSRSRGRLSQLAASRQRIPARLRNQSFPKWQLLSVGPLRGHAVSRGGDLALPRRPSSASARSLLKPSSRPPSTQARSPGCSWG